MDNFLTTMSHILSQPARGCLQDAIRKASSQTHYEVELVHLLLAYFRRHELLVEDIAHQTGLSLQVLSDAMTMQMNGLKKGNSGTPVFSERLIHFIKEAWQLAHDEWRQEQLPSEAFLAVLLKSPVYALSLSQAVAQTLRCDLEKAETLLKEASRKVTPEQPVRDDTVLGQFTRNLTELAQRGELDPVPGRQKEIRSMMDILLRRRQNNPILTGEPGVGKTALVEGLALQIASNNVPPALSNTAIYALDLGALLAGASVRGEFEQRIQAILGCLQNLECPAILFVDEAHMLIGAGSPAGQNDAANLLKPALARGTLRIIAATTQAEYKKYFEKDAALARRFQIVPVEEPDHQTALIMLRSLADKMSQHHGVPIRESALAAAVTLSARYLTERRLPDKAISLLDTACARVAVSRFVTPGEIEDNQFLYKATELEHSRLVQEAASTAQLSPLEQRMAEYEATLSSLDPLWKHQTGLVEKLSQSHSAAEATQLRGELQELHQQRPMVWHEVDALCVADIVSGWTGIPLGRLQQDTPQSFETMLSLLEHRVIGQSYALERLAMQLRFHRAGLTDPEKPVGVFMLAGPSGVGKTETAHALAENLYGGKESLIVVNMSEFQESHSVSGLKGAPPGYVGYGEGGGLTEAIRRKPYSVILLDEIEKAHPDILEVFYQIFDKGQLNDAEGNIINFRNCLFILTSNVATEKLCACSEEERADVTTLVSRLQPEFEMYFRPAFMGRVTLLPYFSLQKESLQKIVRMKLMQLQQRVVTHSSVQISWKPQLEKWVVSECQRESAGAREIDRIINRSVLPVLAEQLVRHGKQSGKSYFISVCKNQIHISER